MRFDQVLYAIGIQRRTDKVSIGDGAQLDPPA